MTYLSFCALCSGTVLGLAIDGTRSVLASCGSDRTIAVLSLASMTPHTVIHTRDAQITSIAFGHVPGSLLAALTAVGKTNTDIDLVLKQN